MKKLIRKVVIIAFVVYFSFSFSRFLIPSPQFHIDTSDVDRTRTVHIFTYANNGTRYDTIYYNGSYHCNVEFSNKNYSFDIVLGERNNVLEVYINGKKINEKYFIHDIPGVYENVSIIHLRDSAQFVWRVIAFLCVAMFLLFVIVFISNQSISFRPEIWRFIYDESSIKAIGLKPVLLSFVVALLSVLFGYGCDIQPLIRAIWLHQSGIDIYQLQSALNKSRNVYFLMWPYNPTMLLFHDLLFFINRLFLGFYKYKLFVFAQIVYFKLTNMLLLNITVLSIISFLLDKGFLDKKRAIKIYWWSVLNPVSFYVAVVFIQFDLFTIYFTLIGVLLLNKKGCPPFLSSLLCAIGTSGKAQALLLIPFLLIFIVTFYLCSDFSFKKRMNFILSWGASFICSLFLFNGIFYIVKGAVCNVWEHTPQRDRAWFTVIPYADTLYLYMSIMVLVVFFICEFSKYNMSLSCSSLTVSMVYNFAILSFLFSFSIMDTPSTYLYSVPAFVLLYVISKDNYQRFIVSSLSVLILFQWIFTNVGDITAGLLFLGKTPLFSKLYVDR